jgi:XRE family aerobic/anaerobic benzoate catabolism transcriptional regulator
MSGTNEAMNDLRRILESRAPFYSKADEVYDTSDKTTEEAFAGLQEQLRTTVSP